MKTLQQKDVTTVAETQSPSPVADTDDATMEYLCRWLEQAWQEAEREAREQAEASPRVSERARFYLD